MRAISRAVRLAAAFVSVISLGTMISCAALRGTSGGGAHASGTGASADAALPGSVRAVASIELGSLTVRKWRLPNGLEIITGPDPGSRSVTYLTLFRVGSRHEDAALGETGLAHLFEHLMFTGAPTNGAGDFDQQVEEAGGSSNATTSYDFTSYVDELPPAALKRVVELEANRMVNLRLDDKQVATERQVVVEERLGSVEDSVDGTLDEMVWGQAFRKHPYRWPIIGRMADIKAITRSRAEDFHQRHYRPDRALVVVVGRFDETTTLAWIEAAYGRLPTGAAPPESPRPIVPERAPAAEVRSEIRRPVPSDRLVVAFPAPAVGDADRAAFDVLDELLTGGPSSRLYRRLVVEQALASSLRGEVSPTQDPGLWCLWVQMVKGNPASRAEELILEEVSRVANEPVGETELVAAKNRLETAFWKQLASSQGKAEALGETDITTGDFRHLISRSRAYASITGADVVRVAKMYVATGARSVVVAVPGFAAPGVAVPGFAAPGFAAPGVAAPGDTP